MTRLLVLAAALLVLCPARAQTATDDAGTRVALPRAAQRIVSLAPHVTELLFAAGAGGKVVGVTEYSDFPPAAASIARVGAYSALDLERIAALRPDLVVAWGSGNPPGQVAALRRLGLPVFVSEPRRLDDVSATLRRIGDLAGTPAAAGTAADAFDRRRAALAAAQAGKPRLAVFYQIWDKPLMTINREHIISAVITLCGGDNVFAGLPSLAPTIGIEAVLRADPQVIVASGMDTRRPEWLDAWKAFPQLRAVRSGQLHAVPPDLLQRHTPRLLDGAEAMCAALDRARESATQTAR